MKRNANWCVRAWTVVLVLAISVAAFSCGGHGNGVANIDSVQGKGSNPSGDQSVSGTKSVALQTVKEDEVATLPGWVQDLLSDPGWNQPYIEPRKDTPMPAPSYTQLMDLTKERLANPDALSPRPAQQGEGGKGVSWNANGGFDGTTLVYPGEYKTAGAQPYGCVNGTVNGHAKEDNLANIGDVPNQCPQIISYALQGIGGVNHFDSTGGSGNDAQSCVYQLYSNARDANPQDPTSTSHFGEVSYRADGGAGAGACAGDAFIVEDFFWTRFNSLLKAIPGTQTQLYNVLIAPGSNRFAQQTAPTNTVARFQKFYLGNVSACYGSGGMVGLVSATNTCQTNFNATYTDYVAAHQDFFTNPIYGVLLKRWNDSVPGGTPSLSLTGVNNPMGWPVFGPIAYNNGVATLTGFGAYYAWGMYFEKGFIWWLDYVNNNQVPDEAEVYDYTGSNVYCVDAQGNPSGVYVKRPSTFYGGQGGTLGVSVSVDASLNPDLTGTGGAAAGSYYQVSLPSDDGLASVSLDMFANGYGGTPNANCDYSHYTWAFRDGTIGVTNATPFDNSTKYVNHAYGSVSRNQESVYIVRVQVVDAANKIAYGDSLPIHVGHGSGGGSAEIWVIRNDGGTYDSNYDAIISDLTDLGASYTEVDYSDTIADDFDASGTGKVAIWYRGGPGGGGEAQPYTTAWTNAEIDNYRQLQSDGHFVLLMSQNHGLNDHTYTFVNGWQGIYGFPTYAPSLGAGPPFGSPDIRRHSWAAGLGTDDGIGFGGSFGFIPCAPTNFRNGANGAFGGDSVNAAERYTGGGSSGQVPVSITLGAAEQACAIGWYSPIFAFDGIASPGFKAGMCANPNAFGFDLGFYSWGNQQAPDNNIGSFLGGYSHVLGPGKVYVVGYGWKNTTVTAPASMQRSDLLRNLLAWLDGSLTFSAVTNNGFSEYEGIPEIVSVTPAYWDETTFQYRSGTPQLSYTGGAGTGVYPDQTSVNCYRTTNDPALSNEVITTNANNDWINGNDVDFQFPGNYCYLNTGADGIVNTSATGVGASDDTLVFLRGYLVNDTGAGANLWTRYSPPAGQIVIKLNAYANPIPVVAGYYTNPVAGDNGAGDTFANYGTELEATNGGGMVAGKEWKNDKPLTCEAIAHWSQSLKYNDFAPFNSPTDPQLNWSMYPGQNMGVPGGALIIGATADWDAYRSSFNVDPTTVVAGRVGSIWNRPVFSYKSPLLDKSGRVVEFNYRTLKNWNPDLNRDGAVNSADKFPIRVRLFSNHQAYYNKSVSPASVWPNNLFNAGLAPPAWTSLLPADPNYPSFVEGGCYAVDRGQPVYVLQVADDPAQPDPGVAGTVHGQPGSYTVDFYYIIRFGNAPYTVDIDCDWGGAFNDGVAGRVVLGLPGVHVIGANHDLVSIPAAMPDGTYSMAVRVKDSAVPQATATWVWPGGVTLAPQFIFRDTFNSYANTAAALAAGWVRANPPNYTYTQFEFGFLNPIVANGHWYWGPQFGAAFNSYNGEMLHFDSGADDSGGTNNYGDQSAGEVRSPAYATPAGTKRLYFRMQLTTGGDTSFWDRCWVAHTANPTAYLGAKYTWPGAGGTETGPILVNTFDPVTQLTLFSYNWDAIAPSAAGYIMFQFDDDPSVNGTGPDIDGVTLESSAAVPPGW